MEEMTYPVELTPVLRKAIMEAKQRGDEAAAALKLTAAFVLLEASNAELDRLVLLARQVQGVDESARLDLGRGWVMPGKPV
jgi:hypothetical protein